MNDTHYHSPDDRRFASTLRSAAPDEFRAYRQFADTVGRTDGAIPQKYRELLAVAVALTTQCVYCIETHSAKAAAAGASKQELAEAVYITAALRAGGGAAHGLMAMKHYLAATQPAAEENGSAAQRPEIQGKES